MEVTTGYDVIGDIHGHVDKLEGLLRSLGYQHQRGAYRHPERTAVFVGDLIDRHPEGQLATVNIVRSMVDAGAAHVVLGNHEFNAVAYATRTRDGSGYCRPHTQQNGAQHKAFIDAVTFGSTTHREVLDWFMTIPLWLDLGGLRVVHACWSEPDMSALSGFVGAGSVLTEDLVVMGSEKDSAPYVAIERLLKGPEISMNGVTYVDRGGHVRGRARARWWDPDATTLGQLAVVPGGTVLRSGDGQVLEALPHDPVPDGAIPLYADEVPVIVGHYWFTGDFNTQSSYVACVDYSAAAGGPLVAYRWNEGDSELRAEQMVGFG